MFTKHRIAVAAVVAFTSLGTSSVLCSITIPTVTIGNPDNAADPFTGDLYGSVAYTYRIGTTEVTNAQYAAFLNAVAATDTNELFHTLMGAPYNGVLYGGITRSGSEGSYTYATVAGRENHPVNFVSFWDSLRFANWLHNGQPMGPQNATTTEDGAYTLTPEGISANTITRNAGAQWAVTSENEWYKAAYHQPASQGGDVDDYWLYPTSSNSAPGHWQANMFDSAIGNTTPVGSYAANFNGTFDMGGNVWEWTESIVSPLFRIHRGGAYVVSTFDMQADRRHATFPQDQYGSQGFRVVSLAAAPVCSGDINGDGGTNAADFVILAGNFGASVSPDTDGDLNGDGIVSAADFVILAGNFGCGS